MKNVKRNEEKNVNIGQKKNTHKERIEMHQMHLT